MTIIVKNYSRVYITERIHFIIELGQPHIVFIDQEDHEVACSCIYIELIKD